MAVTRRDRLRADLLDELLAHSPASLMRHMRKRPGGGISLVHLNVLAVLDLDGPQPMRGLAEALDVSQASATGIVDRMEERGLVARQRGTDDRRVIRATLTDDGRAVLGGLAEERREALGELLNELSDPELEGFLTGARAMRRARERRHARSAEEREPDGGGRSS
jgi:DNA-binding MarR family transcriptional regulator